MVPTRAQTGPGHSLPLDGVGLCEAVPRRSLPGKLVVELVRYSRMKQCFAPSQPRGTAGRCSSGGTVEPKTWEHYSRKGEEFLMYRQQKLQNAYTNISTYR